MRKNIDESNWLEAAAAPASKEAVESWDNWADRNHGQVPEEIPDQWPVIQKAMATRLPWSEVRGKAHVGLNGGPYSVGPGGWLSVKDAITACRDIRHSEVTLTVYAADGSIVQTIVLEG